ncbi:hypothetical protein [Roseibium suaedae]|uniref:Uncharacterized protein n=1 Tax=Roseibium suaedae TaxID=735517 RepID=A0A1M7PII1_9HYPH|nr:hypothetical protein [Roseibium suaedae]SHN16956.1 hypothetical protein SAMN05444272_4441 [Roseibium suaedae]
MTRSFSTDPAELPGRKQSEPAPISASSPDPFNFMNRALENWDGEGGAPAQDSMHSEYGKRVEADGSWTIYHVFTGSPATIGGNLMQDMNAKDALDQMTKTNAGNSTRRAAHTKILKARFLATWWVRLTKYF